MKEGAVSGEQSKANCTLTSNNTNKYKNIGMTQINMKRCFYLFASIFSLVSPVIGLSILSSSRQYFQATASYPEVPTHHLNTIRTKRIINQKALYLSSSSSESETNENINLRPTTSFGAEIVPEAQRPVNEYMDVTSQPFFDWASSNGTKGLLTRLLILYNAFFWMICYPITNATYTMDGYMIQKLVCSNVGAIFVILVFLIRLYSGWNYIGERLTSKVIEYEETGWYDGQFAYKTENELKRDRFLYNSDVKPVVERLQLFLYGTIGITIGSLFAFHIATSAKPLPFDQYNPTVLERLTYDDKLASKASESTSGKPAYCDSRYYQAIANGGQGCN
jgi:Conserved in the green lineage and diatoms 27